MKGPRYQRGYVNPWIVRIIIAIVALIVGIATAPRPKPAARQQGKVPDVKEGRRVIRVYGTVWIDDPVQLAMKQVGEDPIRKKGGKK